jgi:hypothetical protein
MNILDRDVNLLGAFIVFHQFCACTKGDLGCCVNKGSGVDDEVAWGCGDDAFGAGCCEDGCEEFFVLDGAGLFYSNEGLGAAGYCALVQCVDICEGGKSAFGSKLCSVSQDIVGNLGRNSQDCRIRST